MKITVANIKAQISTLIRNAGPITGLLLALIVGFFNPHAFENDYFVLLILFFVILWALTHGGKRMKTAAIRREHTAVKVLKPSASHSRNITR